MTTSTLTTKFEWGFHYAGPLAPTSDRRCVTCNAKASGECPSHEKRFMLGCAHCVAAQGGECQAHWGLDAALAHFEAPATGALTEEARADYEAAKSLLLLDAAPLADKPRIVVSMRGSGPAHLVAEREFYVRVDRR